MCLDNAGLRNRREMMIVRIQSDGTPEAWGMGKAL